MPIEIEPKVRLAQIAEATMRVAEKRGADGVTIRAVAEEMGGSTTLVTNYIPSRTQLIHNAVQYALEQWREDLDNELDGVAPKDLLRTLALWSTGTDGNDATMRQLFIELLARAKPDAGLDALRDDSDEHRDEFHAAAVASGMPDPAFTADILYLVTRGFYFATVERPDAWTSERVQPLITRLLDVLAAAPAKRRTGTASSARSGKRRRSAPRAPRS
jgi:AcrR family transcriptional regulator